MELLLKERLANVANYTKGRVSKIFYIVIHYTANDGDTDEGNGAYFAREKVKASANWFVDEDSATRSVKEENTAWQCGDKKKTAIPGGAKWYGICKNANSIGIEMCSDKVNGKYVITEKTMLNTVELTKYLMAKLGVPPENVIRHFDVTGKNCPSPWVENESEWKRFKSMLTGVSTKKLIESKALIADLQKVIAISDVDGLLQDLIYYHNGSCWWVIKKLLAKIDPAAKEIAGRKDIYRRSVAAVEIGDKGKFNSELISIGNDSIFWVIYKLLNKLGVE